MSDYDYKLRYPTKNNGEEIVNACKGKIMMFTYLDQQHVGEFRIEDGDRYALRLGDIHMLTGIDVYPEMGLVTFANAFDIKSNFK
jgi:hypothetical protein